MKILVADDDLDLLGLVAYSLSQAGYLVVKASDGPGALATFDAEAPDLVILDINMPGTSGFEVCTAIRARGDVPVMMLTARGEEQDLVKALELGADDYLTKPFSPKTLLARVKALLRRASADRASAPLSAGRVTLDDRPRDPQPEAESTGHRLLRTAALESFEDADGVAFRQTGT